MSGWAQRDAERLEAEAEAIEDSRMEQAKLRECCEWRPIETAPKDGSEILIYDYDETEKKG